jgi:CIC family chloride channel protein
VASIGFVFGIRGLSRALRRVPCPEPLRPVIGFGLLGMLGLWVPAILEGGREPTNALLAGELVPAGLEAPSEVVLFLLGIAAVKIVATGLTSGAGGVGGLFTPSLFFGALVGAAYGQAAHALFPGATDGPGAYAVVGMAAMAAGTSHAPISAILILFEFTGNYDLILPLMVASITAGMVSKKLYPYSIYYTESLRRKGVDLNLRMEEAVLAGMGVSDLCREDSETLLPTHDYRTVVDRFFATHRSRLFVVDPAGRLVGEVSLHDIKHVLDTPGGVQAVLAHDLATPPEHVVSWDDRLHQAAEIFAHSDHERLPVVDGGGAFRGIVAKRDLLAVYAQEVLGRPALLATFVSSHADETSRDFVELPPDWAVRLVALPRELEGHTLAEARLPQELGLRVLEVKRPHGKPGGDDERIIPAAETVFRSGDQLIVLGPLASLELLERGIAAAIESPVTEADAMRAID